MTTRRTVLLLSLSILLGACTLPSPASTTPTAPPHPAKYCGDGVCDGPENGMNCPQDCAGTTAPLATSAPPTALRPRPGDTTATYTVTNPTGGARLSVRIYHPPDWDGRPLPTLILVPGGNGITKPEQALRLAEQGFTVIAFDPDGRGASEGEEDYGGFIQQDGLAEVVRSAVTQEGVDPDLIALATFSYGITMGSGALARYPDLPVRFLIDWEGPANRDDTGGCDSDHLGHLKDVASCDDEAFWAQREAATFIGQVRVPYQRIQSQKDHVQPDVYHALLMVNNAVEGGVPWVRLNDEPPNQTYDFNAPPPMLPDSTDRQVEALVARYAWEIIEDVLK
ncbi:MAG: hypothetical protein D6770_05755 [Anaerolineae bacterium]|nr:MAG: hypothetical protein D6770_05755 [Anaerolineae bacterium]